MAALAAFALVTVSASAVHAQNAVTVSWDRNSDSTTVGYRLYYGTSSGNYQWNVDAGNRVSTPVSLSPGSVYYMVVRGYNAAAQIGPPSAEVSINLGGTPNTPTTPTSPTAPTARIQASLQSANTAIVSWQTTNATAANINGNSVGASGSTTVTVNETTTFTITATGAGGATARASATVNVGRPSEAAPTPPASLAAAVSGSRVTLTWRRGSGGGAASDFLIYAGTSSWSSNLVDAYSLGNVLSVSSDLPPGRYFARVRARNAGGTSGTSNQVEFYVGRALATPTRFDVSWQGSTATLQWNGAAGDSLEDTPSTYVLDVGSSPGLSDIASTPVGNVTSFSADIAAGTYYVSVRAVNSLGTSRPTREIEIVAPGAPKAPAALNAGGTGNVDLRWNAPEAGPAPTGYLIEAGSAPGLSDLAQVHVSTLTQFSTAAPAGVYYVRVRAVNDSGAGPASNEVVVQR
jgi:hypothetical protein